MRIPVFLDGGDIDCCLAVPSVGDPVEWSLLWSDDPDDPAAVDIPWDVVRPLQLDPEESWHVGVESGYLLTHGPVSAWWRAAGGRSLPLRGVLEADAHCFVPDRVPETRGRALEVSLVIQTRREADRNGYEEAVSGGTSVWPVAEGLSWHDWEHYAALAGPLPAGQRRSPRGVLVVVDVAP